MGSRRKTSENNPGLLIFYGALTPWNNKFKIISLLLGCIGYKYKLYNRIINNNCMPSKLGNTVPH